MPASAKRHDRETVNLPEMSRALLVEVLAGQAELVCVASRAAGRLFHPKVVLVSGDRVAG